MNIANRSLPVIGTPSWGAPASGCTPPPPHLIGIPCWERPDAYRRNRYGGPNTAGFSGRKEIRGHHSATPRRRPGARTSRTTESTSTARFFSAVFSPCSMKAKISFARQQVVLGPNLTAAGARPCFTHNLHVDRETGIRGGMGGSAVGFPMICGSLRRLEGEKG